MENSNYYETTGGRYCRTCRTSMGTHEFSCSACAEKAKNPIPQPEVVVVSQYPPKQSLHDVGLVDATPNDSYPVRILEAYRRHCDIMYATDSEGNCDNVLYVSMNQANRARVLILDRALKIMREGMFGKLKDAKTE